MNSPPPHPPLTHLVQGIIIWEVQVGAGLPCWWHVRGCVQPCAVSSLLTVGRGTLPQPTARVDRAGGGQDQTHASSPAAVAVTVVQFAACIARKTSRSSHQGPALYLGILPGWESAGPAAAGCGGAACMDSPYKWYLSEQIHCSGCYVSTGTRLEHLELFCRSSAAAAAT